MFLRTASIIAALSLAAACGPVSTSPDGSGPPQLCGAGTHRVGMYCELGAGDAGPIVCGIGTHIVGDQCVANATMTADGGLADPTTWQTNVQVTPSTARSAAEPQMAVDSHGNIYVASMFARSTGGSWGVHLFRSSDVGAHFTEVTAFDPTGRSDFFGDVTVAIDHSDRLFFGWIEYHYQSSGAIAGELMVLQSTDGMQFGTPQRVSEMDPNNEFNDRPWLAMAPDGSMYVSWTNGPSDLNGVGARFARSMNGLPFGAVQPIFDPNSNEEELEESPLGFDADGSPVAASSLYGYDTSTGQLSYTFNAWRIDSDSWTAAPVTNLVSEPRFTFETYVELTSDSHGVITAAYLNGLSRVVTMYVTRSTDGARTWSTPVRVLGNSAPASTVTLPWITHDEADRIHLMWLDNRYGNWVPYTTYSSDGVVFSPAERIGDAQFVEDGASQRWIGDFTSIVVRGGVRYAVWSDTRSGVSQVYFSAAPAP